MKSAFLFSGRIAAAGAVSAAVLIAAGALQAQAAAEREAFFGEARAHELLARRLAVRNRLAGPRPGC